MINMTRFFLSAAAAMLIMTMSAAVKATTLPNFTAVLVFGDSTVDTGNNNYVRGAVFKADHLPYGEIYPTRKPTGRFSDGKLIPDLVAGMLGVKKDVPPYMDPNLSDDDIKTGVVFGSSGTGFDGLTAVIAKSLPVAKQLEMFREYIGRLRRVVGVEDANRTVEKGLVIVSCGTNDMVDNFYDLKTRRLGYDLDRYQNFLLNKVESFLKKIYSLGGRTMVVAGLPPIGCLPIQMTTALDLDPNNRKCIESQNTDSQSYNTKLKKLLCRLQDSLPRSKFLYANIYDPLLDMVNNPSKYGFEETSIGCCGTGLMEVAALCSPTTPTCRNKTSKYVFFDSIHPTQATYAFLSNNLALQVVSSFSPPPH
ncbi:GDSL esterase/lipase At2g30310 [Linum perenne]